MNKKWMKKYFSILLVTVLTIVGLGSLVTNVEAAELSESGTHTTTVNIHAVETDDEAEKMNTDVLEHGIEDLPEYFGTGAEPLQGVVFDVYEVSQQDFEDLLDDNTTIENVTKKTLKTENGIKTNENGTATIDLEKGFYWVVERKLGTIDKITAAPFGLSLPYTNSDGTKNLGEINVYPKNTLEAVPHSGNIRKTVKNANGNSAASVASTPSAAIGEINKWTITMDIPKGIEEYAYFGIYVEIDSKLDFEDNIEIKVPTEYATNERDFKEGEDYIVEFNHKNNIGKFGKLKDKELTGSLRINFTEAGLDKLSGVRKDKLSSNEELTVSISYDTKINHTADIGKNIYNGVVLEFNNGHGDKSKPSYDPNDVPVMLETEIPSVVTGGASFVIQDNLDTETKLNGAEFIIKKGENQYVSIAADGTVKFVGENENPTTFTSGDDGEFKVRGLPYGEYTLIETKAPEGYALPTNHSTFTVRAESYNVPEEILSKKITIPQTGGMGTVAFTVIGAALMVFAVVYYKKSSPNENA